MYAKILPTFTICKNHPIRVGKNSSPMDPMGAAPQSIHYRRLFG